MIKNLNKFLAVLATVISLSVAWSHASAQTVIFSDKFNSSADSAGSPALPTGWTTTGGYKKWVFTNGNATTTSTPPVNFSFDADANPTHGPEYGISLDTADVLTSPDLYAGKSTSSYKTVSLGWVEEFSPKWMASNDSGSNVAYSIDGSTWDSVAYTRNYSGNTFGYANGGNAINLPANTIGAAHLYLRWTFYPKVAKGNYAFTDLVVSGSTTTGINENIYSSNNKVSAFYSNNTLNVCFDNCSNTPAQMAVFSMDGKQVLASALNTGSSQIVNVSTLSAGAYIAKFTINGEVYNTKFVK